MYINWLYGYPIIPGLFLVHFLYCSSQNYSGIMCTCKPIPPTNYKSRIGCHMWQLLMLLQVYVCAFDEGPRNHFYVSCQ